MSSEEQLTLNPEQASVNNNKTNHKNCPRWVVCMLVILVVGLAGCLGYTYFDNGSSAPSRIPNSKTSKNKYYAVVDKSLNYFDANKYCSEQYGTSLATIFDMYDNKIVNDLCKWTSESSNGDKNNASTHGGCWIGYTKSDTYKSWQFWIESNNDGDNDWFWLWYNRVYDWSLLFNDSDDVNILTNNFENWNGKYQKIEDDTACALLLNKNGTWNSEICSDEYYPFVCNCYPKTNGNPSLFPSSFPTYIPSLNPTRAPTYPTHYPTPLPTKSPTPSPTPSPTKSPTPSPTPAPATTPTKSPTKTPTKLPTRLPTKEPTDLPTNSPTKQPTALPTKLPTNQPTALPTKSPTYKPTNSPTKSPTDSPTKSPTKKPTRSPTNRPTKKPTMAPVSKNCASFSSPPSTNEFLSGFNMFSNSLAGGKIFDTTIVPKDSKIEANKDNGGCLYYLPESISSWTDSGVSSCSSSSLSFSSSYTSYSSYTKSEGTSLSIKYQDSDSSDSNGTSGSSDSKGSSDLEAFTGSLSAVRSTMKSSSYSSETYFYSMDISCNVAAFTLKSENYLKFDESFVSDMMTLPNAFESNDISVYKTFWNKYGTHYMFYAEMGGNIYGAASADSCSLTKTKVSESQFKFDLNSVLNANDSKEKSSTTTVNLCMSNSKFTITGGNSNTFASILSSFSTTTSNVTYSYAAWLATLFNQPTPTQGTYIGIHELFQHLGKYYDGGNLLNMTKSMNGDTNWTADRIYNVGKAVEDAYNYYSGILNDDEMQCQYKKNGYSCTSGKGVYFDNKTCSCTCETNDSYHITAMTNTIVFCVVFVSVVAVLYWQ